MAGRAFARTHFDSHGLVHGQDYMSFHHPKEAVGFIDPAKPQLVLTSHSEGVNAFVVAEEVKKLNSTAMVFAWTSNQIGDRKRTCLDGRVSKNLVPPLVSDFVKAFLAGKSKKYLLGMVEE